MAITQVTNRKPQTKTVTREGDINTLNALGATVGAIGSLFTANPLIIGGAAINAAQAFKKPQIQQRVSIPQHEVTSSGGAISRRAQLAGQDSALALREAIASLNAITIDPETKAAMEAPLLKALQSRGGMA